MKAGKNPIIFLLWKCFGCPFAFLSQKRDFSAYELDFAITESIFQMFEYTLSQCFECINKKVVQFGEHVVKRFTLTHL